MEAALSHGKAETPKLHKVRKQYKYQKTSSEQLTGLLFHNETVTSLHATGTMKNEEDSGK